ncbi:MAG: hypothetical protein JO340_09125 [Acidobacteriaceae bacterium]|nr:hypothetical protein [Acidobacteriaceae bacterium]
MGTPAQVAANQANSLKSTGPKSPDGKARSSRNSFKHGLYSKQLVLPHEDPGELDRLRASLRAEHSPINTTEDILVNELAENFWRLRRMREREAAAMQPGSFGTSVELGLLAIIQRTMASAERGLHRSLTALRRLQKDRGFVPQISEAADDRDSTHEQPAAPSTPATAVPLNEVILFSRDPPPPNGFVPEELRPFVNEAGILTQEGMRNLSAHIEQQIKALQDRFPEAGYSDAG